MKAFIAYVIMSLFFTQMPKMTNNKYSFLSHSYYITIKINKSGNQNIYFNGFIQINEVSLFTKPDEIDINKM